MVRQSHIPEKIDSLIYLLQAYLLRMQIKIELFFEKIPDYRNERFEFFPIEIQDDEIIAVAEAIFAFRSMLHELVEFIQINIRE